MSIFGRCEIDSGSARREKRFGVARNFAASALTAKKGPVPISQCAIEFRRRGDLLMYRYHPCKSENRFASWKREDADVWLVRHESLGWVGVSDQGEVLCMPWAVPPGTQGQAPPSGVWVSRKAEESYVYDLVYV